MSALESFDLDEDLPHGRLAIEASAGTGKTYALSTLAARYVAEEAVAISEVLIVTFTRAAAAELKDRVRARLVEFADALAGDKIPEEPLLSRMWSTDRAERLSRVRAAIAEFDSATITTIHGFAQQVLGTLGSAAVTDPDAVLVDDAGSLVAQVATDLLVAEAVEARNPPDEIPDLATLVRAAGLALGNPGAHLLPGVDPDESSPAAARRRVLVDAVVAEVERRRQVAGTQSFDDLLVRLRDALADERSGGAARQSIQHRFRVALIDEFQDTDPVQWAIFDTVFGNGGDDAGDRATSLVLVGDPKQAIYAFRGANVHTYLQAARAPGTERRSLGTNWRSDPGVLHATECLLRGATFGDGGITFQPVSAPEKHRDRKFRSRDGRPLPSLSIRLVDGPNVPRTKKDPRVAVVDGGAQAVFAELAVYLRDLLDMAEIPDNTAPGAYRPLRPDDIAVLVSANHEGPVVRRALGQLGIPAVISRGDNVLTSEAANHWHRLLAAVARPTDSRRARAVAISWFVGWDAGRVAAATDEDLASLQEQLHAWGEHLSTRGVAAFVGKVRAETGVAARVLAREDGDRAMTDLDHIGELLVLAAGRRPSPATLLSLFEQLAGGNDDGDPEADLAARRVESEARSVQIMTGFVAKGLEFPVVCCPSMWRPRGAKADDNVWWEPDLGRRAIDVASDTPWGDEDALEQRMRASASEAVGTNLRVLYVALTRAEHHTAVWWLPTGEAGLTGLARVLFARGPDGVIDEEAFTASSITPPSGDDALRRLEPVVVAADGALEVTVVDAPGRDQPRWSGAAASEVLDLKAAVLGRTPDRARTRWSFTSILARSGGHGGAGGGDPFDDTLGDARADDEGSALDQTDDSRLDPQGATAGNVTPDTEPAGDPVGVLPLGDIPGGAGFGTLVHKVLEVIDFTAPQLQQELEAAVSDSLNWSPWPVDRDRLVAGLMAVIDTPLGPMFADRPLRDLKPADRLDEMSFDLTLGEGGGRPSDADLGELLLRHLGPDDALRGWASRLATGPFSTVLAGHLTGSIDLVARVRHPDGVERFVVCDYKTNRLARSGVTPTAENFRPGQLPAAMADADYPLQALLYSVALHRYLRWRLGGTYEPAVHLGGVGYLFVRGMVGPNTPTTDGVPDGLFQWHPPSELIIELSDLLHGRTDDGAAT